MCATRHSEHNVSVRCRSCSAMPPIPRFGSALFVETSGTYTACTMSSHFCGVEHFSQRLIRVGALRNPRTTREYLAMRFAGFEHEVFCCLRLATIAIA
jgi:DNA repair protein RadC